MQSGTDAASAFPPASRYAVLAFLSQRCLHLLLGSTPQPLLVYAADAAQNQASTADTALLSLHAFWSVMQIL